MLQQQLAQVTDPLSVKQSAIPRREPGAFGVLWTIAGAAVDTEYQARKVKLKISGPGAISVQVGSEYVINGGARTADPGTVADGDVLQVFHTSSASYNAAVTGGVVIDGVSCDFIIETMVEPVADGFPYTFPFTLG